MKYKPLLLAAVVPLTFLYGCHYREYRENVAGFSLTYQVKKNIFGKSCTLDVEKNVPGLHISITDEHCNDGADQVIHDGKEITSPELETDDRAILFDTLLDKSQKRLVKKQKNLESLERTLNKL